MTDASPSSIGIVVTAEQLPLLRDVIVAQHLDVYISDTQNTLLLDDQWKPWIRRVRPQRVHCPSAVWLMAPCYSWPDELSHPRIRTIIAEQLQSCIQMAAILGATGLVLPIEQAQPAFHTRISYYLNLIADQLKAHDLSLMIGVTDTVDLSELMQLLQTLPYQYSLFIESEHVNNVFEDSSDTAYHAQVLSGDEDLDNCTLPTWTYRYVISANENVSHIRKKIQWIQAQIVLLRQTDHVADETVDSNQSLLLNTDDKIT